jgi:prophage regulatory protein
MARRCNSKTSASGDDHFVFLTAKQIAEDLHITRRCLERWVAAGQFPRPVKIGGRSVRWRLSDVRSHLEGLQQAAK